MTTSLTVDVFTSGYMPIRDGGVAGAGTRTASDLACDNSVEIDCRGAGCGPSGRVDDDGCRGAVGSTVPQLG
jgi:hypothetical protein